MMIRLAPTSLAAAVAGFWLIWTPPGAAAQSPAQTLSEAQALLSQREKGLAAVLLVERLEGLSEGNPAADELLGFALTHFQREPRVKVLALEKLDLGQATRLAQEAEFEGDLARELLVLERWRELGGSDVQIRLRLSWAQAVLDGSNKTARATLESLLNDQSLPGNVQSSVQSRLAALTVPDSLEALDALSALREARQAAGRRDRARDAARQFAFGCEQGFYTEFLADENVSNGVKADREIALIETLFFARKHGECREVCQRALAKAGEYGADAAARASFYAALSRAAGPREYREAVEDLWDFIDAYPEHELVPEALYDIGDFLTAIHERALALSAFELAVDLYPETEAAYKASERLRQWMARPGFSELQILASQIAASDAARHPARAKLHRQWLAQASFQTVVPATSSKRVASDKTQSSQ